MICECEGPTNGELKVWCDRHQCHKTKRWVELCKRDQSLGGGYWQAWEQGQGPGQLEHLQDSAVRHGNASRKKTKTRKCGGCGKTPTILTEGWDVLKALSVFTLSGFAVVDKVEYKHRLLTCDECPSRGDERVNNNAARCGECGCYVAIKARGKAWRCPIGKWSEEVTDAH
jgi:hypothetical protein